MNPGTIYNGEFKNGKMSGQGKLAIASEKTEVSNNECYIGQFEEDRYDGIVHANFQAMEST